MKTIALFFGSFNPIHNAHLKVVQDVIKSYPEIDELWFVVSPQNPFKEQSGLAPEDDRLKMVKLAVGGETKIKASDFEFYLPKPSFTVNTMSELSKKFPDNKFILIFGTDVVNELGKWKDYKKITDNYEIIVFIRDDQKISDKIKKKVKIYGTINSDMPNSSTEIRSLIKSKKPFRYLVPKLVEEYIKENNLYI